MTAVAFAWPDGFSEPRRQGDAGGVRGWFDVAAG